MGDSCHRVLVFDCRLARDCALLIRLSFHVDNLLHGTLFEPPIGANSSCLRRRLALLVHLHPVVVRVGMLANLEAHIVILAVVYHLDLYYLAVDDVRCLLSDN